MSFGKMNTIINIITTAKTKDIEGFLTETDTAIATVHAYREGRHGTERWANRAAFTDATDLFRFRCIQNVEITTAMLIEVGNSRFEITSVENVKGRGMYIEVLAREVKPSG